MPSWSIGVTGAQVGSIHTGLRNIMAIGLYESCAGQVMSQEEK